jgi:hypothetical protein
MLVETRMVEQILCVAPNEKVTDSAEIRAHRGLTLGLKSEMKKWEAEKKLKEIIDRSTDVSALKPSPACTLKWFWEQRYQPLKEPTWKVSSAPKTVL